MFQQSKVFIITGGVRGIGYAVAEQLAHAGHRLVIADISGAAEAAERIRSVEHTTIGLTVDVAKDDDVTGMVAEAKKEFGEVNMLVNHAAIFAVHN